MYTGVVSPGERQRCVNLSPFRCSVCDKAFNFLSSLSNHLKVHIAKSKLGKNSEKIEKKPKTSSTTPKKKSKGKKPDRPLKGSKIPATDTPCSFNCSICFKSFHSISDVLEHVGHHSGNGNARKRVLPQHTAVLTPVTKSFEISFAKDRQQVRWKCDICPKTYSSKDNKKRHMSNCHSGNRPYNCPICLQSFVKLEASQRHVLDHHGNSPDVKLDATVASRKAKESEQVRDTPKKRKEVHVQHVTGKQRDGKQGPTLPPPVVAKPPLPALSSCQFCSKKFHGKGSLDRHVKMKHSQLPFKITDNILEETINLDDLDKACDQFFTCEVCNKSFHQQSSYYRHMRMKHLGRDRVTQDNCLKPVASVNSTSQGSVDTITDMRRTGSSASNSQGKVYSFKSAGDAATISSAGQGTTGTISLGGYGKLGTNIPVQAVKPYFSCLLCKKHYARKYNLACHMNKVHPESKVACKSPSTGKKTMVAVTQQNMEKFCKDCNRLYHNKHSLLRHVKKFHQRVDLAKIRADESPDPDKKFQCHVCGVWFTRICNRNTHMKEFHNLQAPAAKPKPPAVTQQKERAPVSEEMMKKEWPTCRICNVCFTQNGNLKRHMVKVHGMVKSKGVVSRGSYNQERVIDSYKKPYFSRERGQPQKHAKSLTQPGREHAASGKAKTCRQVIFDGMTMNRTRENVKPFLCETCGMCFTLKWTLTRHQRNFHLKNQTPSKQEVNTGNRKLEEVEEEGEEEEDCGAREGVDEENWRQEVNTGSRKLEEEEVEEGQEEEDCGAMEGVDEGNWEQEGNTSEEETESCTEELEIEAVEENEEDKGGRGEQEEEHTDMELEAEEEQHDEVEEEEELPCMEVEVVDEQQQQQEEGQHVQLEEPTEDGRSSEGDIGLHSICWRSVMHVEMEPESGVESGFYHTMNWNRTTRDEHGSKTTEVRHSSLAWQIRPCSELPSTALICPVCRKVFATYGDLLVHRKVHKDVAMVVATVPCTDVVARGTE